ncbi:FtsJ-like methyltransferase family protein [Galdieria sulphuraria]|uniref:Putative tRNA (cytidine(32)/guanosine(34)-2'-O)-methyltransferase n=1 Tax=Galdieria sulphuraria TaxID=130081 RepID=M2Y4K0_GALSU|nr:FtsJ-like methyltransferase family protein [Galdieria sulphuraria]EME30774.1 FtsJ-like methyltransferase family protein [Galdieria sulphuraria]|eukprot:XP_005707294.1 FtsJ-like methyltransferase family protein [Galdieria sulphuraria]
MGRTSKDKRDIYYRKAKEEGYRARSAYKLLQLDQEFNLFKDAENVVDLCAAPGSWSQVVSKRLRELRKGQATIVAVDLQEIAPIEGVTVIQGDITSRPTVETILKEFENGMVDVVLSDGAPDVTGLHDLDEYIQSELILSALNVATFLLRQGGTFVAKVFRGKDTCGVFSRLSVFFENVTLAKPRSSRNSSIEAFFVCRGYSRPSFWQPTLFLHKDASIEVVQGSEIEQECSSQETMTVVMPFVSCGDLSCYDADMAYDIDKNYLENSRVTRSLSPVQAPIHAAYETALARKRSAKQTT